MGDATPRAAASSPPSAPPSDALADFDVPSAPPAGPARPAAAAPPAAPAARAFDPLPPRRPAQPRAPPPFDFRAAALGSGDGGGPRLPARAGPRPAPAPDAATLAALAAQLAQAGGGDGDDDDDPALDPLLARLEATLASLSAADTGGSAGDADPAPSSLSLDGIAGQVLGAMLAKDVMAEPMKEIAAKYPAWLSEHGPSLPPADRARYETQHAVICNVVTLYEADEPDMGALLTLLQEMQACGQPPQAIVDDLAPGLAFGEDGLPVLPGGEGGCCVQ